MILRQCHDTNMVFQEAMHNGFCKERLVFAAVGVEMHPGETQGKILKTMAEKLVEEEYKTLVDSGISKQEIQELLPEGSPLMAKCQDHTKVATLMYRRVERGSLVGAAHLHITILYSADQHITEAKCIKALKLPKVYVDVKTMPAGGLDLLPEAGLPTGAKWNRSEITAFERKLLKNRGNAYVYTAYTLKEIHNKHTRLFASEIGGIGNTVHIFGTKDFLNLAQSLYNLKAGVSVYLKAERLKPFLALGSNLETMEHDNPFPPFYEEEQEEEDESALRHIYLMHDQYNRSGKWWDDLEVTPPPEMDNSLTGKALELHACVTDIMDTCDKEKVSPSKVIARKFKNANETVVKNFNKMSNILYHVYRHLHKPTDNAPMTHINQSVLVGLIKKLSIQITTPAQVGDSHQTTNMPLATQITCHLALLLQPRVRRLKQVFLYGTPGCGKSTLLNLVKSIVGNRAFTPGAEASTAFALNGFIGHDTDVLLMDEMDSRTVMQYTPSQLNGILEGHLDTQVSKKHQVT